MVVTYSSQVKKRQDKSNIFLSIRAIPEEIYVKFAIIFVGHGQLVKHHALWWRQRKQIWGIFFLFFFKYKISRSVNNKAMVHQNTIFKNYFSIYWGFFFLEKWEFIGYSMHLYWRLKSLHFPWTAGCKLPHVYCSDELYLVAMKKKRPVCVKENSWPHFCLGVLFFFNQISISR